MKTKKGHSHKVTKCYSLPGSYPLVLNTLYLKVTGY